MKRLQLSFLLFLLSIISSFAQQYRIQGCVTDSAGNAISAATVLVLQGETVVNAAITDDNGFYEITPVDSPLVNISIAVEYITAKAKAILPFPQEKSVEVNFILPSVKFDASLPICGGTNCHFSRIKFSKNTPPSGTTFEGKEMRQMAGFGN